MDEKSRLMTDLLKLAMGILMILSLGFVVKYFLGEEVISIDAAADVRDEIVIVIDPGHGGIDPGMLGVNGTVEKNINLDISKKLKIRLEQEGFRVILTRSDDAGLYAENAPNKKISDMKERCRIIEESKADYVISIHQNSFSDSAVCGGQVFYYKHSTEGAKLAGCIQRAFKEYVDVTNDRKIKANENYYMLVHTPCPTVIVECGFITNYGEAALLVTEEYQEKVVEAIAKGLSEYLDK